MLTMKVAGMTCGHCVQAVTRAVQTVAPGAHVAVDLDKGIVTVAGDAAPAQLRRAIVDAGYEVGGAD